MDYNIQSYNKGDIIIDENSTHSHMYILMEGEVEIYTGQAGKKILLGRIKAEEHEKPFFGEMALLFNIKRTANVAALTDSKVLIIKSEQDLLNFFKQSPKFALYCFKELSERLYSTTKKFLKSEDDVEYLKVRLSNKDDRLKI